MAVKTTMVLLILKKFIFIFVFLIVHSFKKYSKILSWNLFYLMLTFSSVLFFLHLRNILRTANRTLTFCPFYYFSNNSSSNNNNNRNKKQKQWKRICFSTCLFMCMRYVRWAGAKKYKHSPIFYKSQPQSNVNFS